MIHLQSFRNGDFAKFDRSVVWNVFGPKARLNNEGWALFYENGPGGVLYLDDDELIDGFGINRPGDSALCDMYEVARQIPCLINWDCHSAVADASYLAGIPDWLLNALGEPSTVIHSGDDLIKAIARS